MHEIDVSNSKLIHMLFTQQRTPGWHIEYDLALQYAVQPDVLLSTTPSAAIAASGATRTAPVPAAAAASSRPRRAIAMRIST